MLVDEKLCKMKYLKIQNQGELDIRLVALMGGTTKSKDEFKIGQWGSGLKYTLAYLLKNNMDFKIFIGENEVSVTTEIEVIRDEEFEIICINGKRTSITTQMGGQAWEPWMIVRELWCNALDEGGEVREVTTDLFGTAQTTTFYVQLTTDIKNVWDNWSNFFMHGFEPMCETWSHKIYAGGDTLRLYKQGVLIYEDKKVKSLFSYDIKNADINELREFKGVVAYEMTRALSDANKRVISYFFENISEKYYEAEMSYEWYTNFSKDWKEVLGDTKIIHRKAVETMIERGIEFDKAAMIVVPENVYKFLTKQFTGIGALRMADKVNEFFEIFDNEIDIKIKSGLATLEACRYFIHPELKFVYGVFGDKRIWAKVNLDTKEIMISECIKNKSHFDIVTTIIEENEHFNTGFGDRTREFQQHFIDLYAKTLLDKNQVPV
jgi:hypothetical protein